MSAIIAKTFAIHLWGGIAFKSALAEIKPYPTTPSHHPPFYPEGTRVAMVGTLGHFMSFNAGVMGDDEDVLWLRLIALPRGIMARKFLNSVLDELGVDISYSAPIDTGRLYTSGIMHLKVDSQEFHLVGTHPIVSFTINKAEPALSARLTLTIT